MLAPEYLEQCVAALDAHPDAVLCQTLVEQIGASGEFLSIFDTSATGADSPWPSERFGRRSHVPPCHRHLRRDPRRGSRQDTPSSPPRRIGQGAPRRPRPREPLHLRQRTALHPQRSSWTFRAPGPQEPRRGLVWHGADRSAKQVWSWWRHYRALFGLVARRVPDRRERLRCYGHLLRWLTIDRNFRGLVGDALWALDPRAVTALRALSQWWRGQPPAIDSRRRIWAQPNDARQSSLRAGRLTAHGDER